MSFFVFQRKSGLKEKESSTQRVNLQHGLTYYRCLLLRWKEGAEGGARGKKEASVRARKDSVPPWAAWHIHRNTGKKARQTSHNVDIFVFFLAMSVSWRRDNYICKVLWSSTPVSFPCFCFQTLAFVFKRKKKAWPWLHKSPNCWKKVVYQLSLVVWTELKCQKCKKRLQSQSRWFKSEDSFLTKAREALFSFQVARTVGEVLRTLNNFFWHMVRVQEFLGI